MTTTQEQEIVSLREAKANLSRYASHASGGMRVVITRHGVPVADLVPHGLGTDSQLKKPRALPEAIQLSNPAPSAADWVLQDRE